ncbi:GNAT family N-acetyltransferase [Robiginitalea sp. IMCC43444]|uniref:GNAT family N-acetyltransferase n=1 Tax=Robiginitalea sp. IMCC43444 TaxID=3459121 RepID=UPI00404335EC
MIEKLNHSEPGIAQKIRAVFQESYAVEASLLKAKDFPPLRRPLKGFTHSKNDFYAYTSGGQILGVIEIDFRQDTTHIQSLVVLPAHFRKGIGKSLVNFAFKTYPSGRFTVETGLQNDPATTLYRKLGFREVGQYIAEAGIRKIQFEKSITG